MLITVIITMIVIALCFVVAFACITSEADEEFRIIVKDIEDYIEFHKGKKK